MQTNVGESPEERFGFAVRDLRKKIGLTQEMLAQQLAGFGYKLKASTIATWEQGRGLPDDIRDFRFFDALGLILGTSPSALQVLAGVVKPQKSSKAKLIYEMLENAPDEIVESVEDFMRFQFMDYRRKQNRD